MFEAISEVIDADWVVRYTFSKNGETLKYFEVLQLWQSSSTFRSFCTELFAQSVFPAYRWETPGVSRLTLTQPFEFIFVNYPQFTSGRTDAKTFEGYFTDNDVDHGVVSFANLSGDSQLVVPSPRTDIDAYGHLAAFMRHAPQVQQDAFWRVMSSAVKSQIDDRLVWLNTAGGGVAWLHVRIDSRPKYYCHLPYKKPL